MDSDAFYPAFVTAARVLGLGEYAIKALEASGIRLHQRSLIEEPNSITWVAEKTKAIREKIVGWGGENNGRLELQSTAEEGAEPFGKAELSLRSFIGGVGGQIFASVQKGAAVFNPLIIDAEGKSSFLQLLSAAAKRKVTWGTGIATYTEGSQITNNVAVNHGLEVTPVLILAVCRAAATPAFVGAANIFAENEVNFNVNFVRPGIASTGNVGFYWLAIG